MRKDKLYFLTFISISVIFLIIASFSLRYFIKASASQLLEIQLESNKREANEVSKLIHYQIAAGLSQTKVLEHVQNTIENTHKDASFISVFNWSGIEMAHSDITQVGVKINSNQSLQEALNEEDNSNDIYDLFTDQIEKSIANGNIVKTEVTYISAVKDSDLIVAAHINLVKIATQIKDLKTSFYIIFMLMGGLIILSSFFAVRMIGSYYEKQLELKNTTLESELLNLSKLNTDLLAYQQKVIEDVKEETEGVLETSTEFNQEFNKTRILTYVRNELVSVPTDKIAYIYTENTITYVVRFDEKKSTTNMSLDDLFTNLSPSLFFRANRQFIISITAIAKIIKYGNSQLKILIHDADVEIIISKNKAAEFRQWLNM
ncbi:transcriptional regulator [Flavivirga aquatica]|uniref:Transcriptional regulator n=1 Tax=Flavivirga aquatica TaxID=1849968 RepID=A0A1E5T8Z8_9FLAO|nr:LytTR family DNA-binding domain-containing protein [Flavivirga aquatica]OEK07844.1 transcriptional regulator [Flavivirga aquatica]